MVILKEMNYIVLRSRGRTALSVCIAALLVCCMSFYLGSIQTAESAEENLAQVIPVTAQVVSRQRCAHRGVRDRRKSLCEPHEGRTSKTAVYTASACANFQEQYRAEDVQGADTSVTAVSGLSALVGVTEENIAFENGYDLSFLERAEPLCVVSQSYAAQYGLNSGRHALDAVLRDALQRRRLFAAVRAPRHAGHEDHWRVRGQRFGQRGAVQHDRLCAVAANGR